MKVFQNKLVIYLFIFLLNFIFLSEYSLSRSRKNTRKRDHITDYFKSSIKGKKRKKKKKKKKKHEHKHSQAGHSHDHGHEEHSKWMVGLGVSISQSASSPSSSGSGGGDSGDHSGHQHLVDSESTSFAVLDEGHDHGGSEGGENSEGGEAGGQNEFNPVFDASIGYMASSAILLNLSGGYALNGGLLDPSVGAVYNYALTRKVKNSYSVSFSLPFSEASQEDYKLTTATLTVGLKKILRKYSLGVTGLVAYSMYSKTIIKQYEDGSTEPTNANREFNRYGGNLDFSYKFTPTFHYGGALSLTMIQHQFEDPTIVTDATIVKLTYILDSFSVYAALASSKQDTSPGVPDTIRMAGGMRYNL